MGFDWNDFDLHTPELYASRGYPWEAWDKLRAEAPVYWYERDDIDPFWAVTRHADVVTVDLIVSVCDDAALDLTGTELSAHPDAGFRIGRHADQSG